MGVDDLVCALIFFQSLNSHFFFSLGYVLESFKKCIIFLSIKFSTDLYDTVHVGGMLV